VTFVIFLQTQKSDNYIMGILSRNMTFSTLKTFQLLADNVISLKKANQPKGWDAKPLA
jgi:hypothetical protein